jgi:hypothetical protein
MFDTVIDVDWNAVVDAIIYVRLNAILTTLLVAKII